MPTLVTKIIENPNDLLHTALACVYGCPRTDQLDIMNEIFYVRYLLFIVSLGLILRSACLKGTRKLTDWMESTIRCRTRLISSSNT